MYKTSFGTNMPPQINFENPSEYYRALGYLAKSDGSSSIHWENNEQQGAWASEGRIHFYISDPNIPGYFKLTAGTGKAIHRTNCNEFIEHIKSHHGFVIGKNQNIDSIRNTIPSAYISDFDFGLTIQ